jgi:hypothetical protein
MAGALPDGNNGTARACDRLDRQRQQPRRGLMAIGAARFIGDAVLLVRNFTDSFLELGIGPAEVNVGKDQIQQFSPSLYHYISHLHIAVSGFIAAAGFGVLMLALKGVGAGQV